MTSKWFIPRTIWHLFFFSHSCNNGRLNCLVQGKMWKWKVITYFLLVSISRYWAEWCWGGPTHKPVALTVPPGHTWLWDLFSCASEDDICSHQSHDRVLRAHGHGHGHVFRLFLRDGMGLLQPEAERRRGGVWHRETSSATQGRALGLRSKSSRAEFEVRLYACAGPAVHSRGSHADHLHKLLWWHW